MHVTPCPAIVLPLTWSPVLTNGLWSRLSLFWEWLRASTKACKAQMYFPCVVIIRYMIQKSWRFWILFSSACVGLNVLMSSWIYSGRFFSSKICHFRKTFFWLSRGSQPRWIKMITKSKIFAPEILRVRSFFFLSRRLLPRWGKWIRFPGADVARKS